MLKRSLPLMVFTALLTAGNLLPAQGDPPVEEIRWYRSNASGMALEFLPSRLGAMRNEHSLSIEGVSPGQLPRLLPEILLPYYVDLLRETMQRDEPPLQGELRTLYEEDMEIRRQWILRDHQGINRLVASGNSALFSPEDSGLVEDSDPDSPEGENKTGFIEIRNGEGSIVREFRFEEDRSQWEFRFIYHENTLLSTETWHKSPPEEEDDDEPIFVLVYIDNFRYTRFGSLRAIDRTLQEGAGEIVRAAFPRIGPDLSPGEEMIASGTAYTPAFLQGTGGLQDLRVSYSLDNRGRILSETWMDEEGRVLGELVNTWSEERLLSILWRTQDEERLVLYEYDSEGNRIVEQNYHNGILERSVVSRDGRETEEIFMNGRLVLRAYWEGGVRLFEERIPSSDGGSP